MCMYNTYDPYRERERRGGGSFIWRFYYKAVITRVKIRQKFVKY